MKFRVIWACAALLLPVMAEEGREPDEKLTRPAAVQGPAWLGFRVSKPDDETRAHLPELPAGIGFVVKSVEPKGPAEKCGLQPTDVVWKFGDQLLVNEAQLVTLLRLRKPGEAVQLAIFRSGRRMELTIELGSYPLNRPFVNGPQLDPAILPGEGPRWFTTNVESRTATLSTTEGRAVLKRMANGGYELEIRDPEGELIFNGNLPVDGDTAAVPEVWRRPVCAARRSLDNVIEGRVENARAPRPRVVPVPSSDRHADAQEGEGQRKDAPRPAPY